MPHLDTILKRCITSPPNILAALQKVQEVLGYIPQDAVPKIATALGVTDSDVVGVLSFYHDLRTTPPGRHMIRFCLGDSCRATHCEKSLQTLKKNLACEFGETTTDGRYTLEKVYCLGNCALSPSLMIDDEIYGQFTPETVSKHLENHP